MKPYFRRHREYNRSGYDYYFEWGKFHMRLNTGRHWSFHTGWNCTFWYTGLFIWISRQGVKLTWREHRDYAE